MLLADSVTIVALFRHLHVWDDAIRFLNYMKIWNFSAGQSGVSNPQPEQGVGSQRYTCFGTCLVPFWPEHEN